MSSIVFAQGRHRRPRQLQFAIIVAFWGVVVAGSGFVAGFVWAQALS